LITYDSSIAEFLKEFPEASEKAEAEKKSWGSDEEQDELKYVFFGIVVNYLTINALKANDNPQLLSRLFRFFEAMAASSETEVINLLKWGILEVIGDDKQILKRARSLMGQKTLLLSQDTERHWGRE
jgi:hypothetical protein